MNLDPDSALLTLQLLLTEFLSTNTYVVLSVLILVLLVFTALIAGSEVAFFSLSAKDINYIKQKEDHNHKSILNLLENPKRFLATLLICNNFLSIGVIITSNMLFGSLLQVDRWFPGLSESVILLMNVLIQVVLVTFFLVLFGEVLPKVYATQNNLNMARFTAPLLLWIDRMLKPLSSFLVSSTSFIEGRFKVRAKNEISSEDVEHVLELTVGNTASKEEVNIYKGILNFDEITVKQIMKTRLDVSGLDIGWNFPQVKKQVSETGFSRLPVYDESLDEVKGILYTKDLLAFIQENQSDWHTLIRPALFVHETKLIKDLLRIFQQKHSHMAIVVDEFGGTSGIVTLEDIMEEIIGEIKDEFDEDEHAFRKINENQYIFEGKTLINDLCRILAMPLEIFEEVRGESDSIGGLVLEIAGKFPAPNEIIRFDRFEFQVLQIDQHRIQKVKLTIHPPLDAIEE
ncbi:MAG: gliding motility-associated protein GldE [Chitinophagaceae bacterium]|nr:gliding motility-associated protein GldE [Chitinophagaceae bacterium]